MRINAITKGDWPNYKVETTVGNVMIVQDEPLIQGGLNQGPSPFEAVMMGLASCTLITLRMYLEHKQAIDLPTPELVDLPTIEVSLAFTVDGRSVKIEQVERSIKITTNQDLDDSRLLAVANKCPVHNMLSTVIPIVTTLEVIAS